MAVQHACIQTSDPKPEAVGRYVQNIYVGKATQLGLHKERIFLLTDILNLSDCLSTHVLHAHIPLVSPGGDLFLLTICRYQWGEVSSELILRSPRPYTARSHYLATRIVVSAYDQVLAPVAHAHGEYRFPSSSYACISCVVEPPPFQGS